MKKVTKFLSILLLVAMCMSLFGGSAYALELGGDDSSSAPTAGSEGVQFGDAYLDGGSADYSTNSLEFGDFSVQSQVPVTPVTNGAAAIGDTQYATLEEAIAAAKSGDTVTLKGDVTSNAAITISNAVTIDLADNTWNINGGLNVNAALTVTDSNSDGKLYMNSAVNVNGYILTLNNLDLYVKSSLKVYFNGKIEMKNVYNTDFEFSKSGLTSSQLVIYSGGFKFNPEGYNAMGTVIDSKSDANKRFLVKVGSTEYKASVNGTNYETLQAAFDAAKSGDTVYALMQTGDNKLGDATLNSGKSIVLNLNNEEITKGNITVNAGSTLTITNGWIDETVANYGTLTISGNAKVGTLRVKGGAAYINGKVGTLNTDDGSIYMSDSNASIDEINVYNTPNLYISGGTVGSISENTTNAPKQVTGGEWGSANVEGYVADGYEAKQQVIGTWTVQAKGFVPVTPAPTPSSNPTTAPTPTGKPVNASITLERHQSISVQPVRQQQSRTALHRKPGRQCHLRGRIHRIRRTDPDRGHPLQLQPPERPDPALQHLF